MQREYWTELDGSNGHYEISNFGRIRNARTGVIKKCYVMKDGRKIFDINYKDTGRKRIVVKREVLKHFGDQLNRNQFVRKIDPNGDYNIQNLEIYSWQNIERRKKKIDQVIKTQSKDNWNKAIELTMGLLNSELYKGACRSRNIEMDELENEALANIMTDYDFGETLDIEKLRPYCRKKIEEALRMLCQRRNERFDDYQIGINYSERDLWGCR